jgi:hypothetical protein
MAATFEKANTYLFAGSLIRNAEVRGSIPLCSTNKHSTLQPLTKTEISRFTHRREGVKRRKEEQVRRQELMKRALYQLSYGP